MSSTDDHGAHARLTRSSLAAGDSESGQHCGVKGANPKIEDGELEAQEDLEGEVVEEIKEKSRKEEEEKKVEKDTDWRSILIRVEK
jgi:hypothetical protein